MRRSASRMSAARRRWKRAGSGSPKNWGGGRGGRVCGRGWGERVGGRGPGIWSRCANLTCRPLLHRLRPCPPQSMHRPSASHSQGAHHNVWLHQAAAVVAGAHTVVVHRRLHRIHAGWAPAVDAPRACGEATGRGHSACACVRVCSGWGAVAPQAAVPRPKQRLPTHLQRGARAPAAARPRALPPRRSPPHPNPQGARLPARAASRQSYPAAPDPHRQSSPPRAAPPAHCQSCRAPRRPAPAARPRAAPARLCFV